MSKNNLNKTAPLIELGNPLLRKPSTPIKDVFDTSVQHLIDTMLVTLKAENGIGLAAIQIGVPLALFIVSPHENQTYPHDRLEDSLVVINPNIRYLGNKKTADWEGCLSIPGIRGKVSRPDAIEISYVTRLGESRTEQYTGFTSRIFQHEFDHLQGTVFLDKMKRISDLITDNEYRRLFESPA